MEITRKPSKFIEIHGAEGLHKSLDRHRLGLKKSQLVPVLPGDCTSLSADSGGRRLGLHKSQLAFISRRTAQVFRPTPTGTEKVPVGVVLPRDCASLSADIGGRRVACATMNSCRLQCVTLQTLLLHLRLLLLYRFAQIRQWMKVFCPQTRNGCASAQPMRKQPSIANLSFAPYFC